MATEFGTSPSLPGLLAAAPAGGYERRRPEQTEMHTVVREQLETFLARARERDRPVPRFVEREFRAYLECGILAHGFLRLHCYECQQGRLVPFWCKRRGFCPSCGGRRMADTAAQMVAVRAGTLRTEAPPCAIAGFPITSSVLSPGR